jgi:hypothetical protein
LHQGNVLFRFIAFPGLPFVHYCVAPPVQTLLVWLPVMHAVVSLQTLCDFALAEPCSACLLLLWYLWMSGAAVECSTSAEMLCLCVPFLDPFSWQS